MLKFFFTEIKPTKFVSAQRLGRHDMTFVCKYSASMPRNVTWLLNGYKINNYTRHFKVVNKFYPMINKLISILILVSSI